MPKSHPPYPQEFRRRLVDLVAAGRSPQHLAKEFEPSAPAITNSGKQAEPDDGRRDDGLTSTEPDELQRLRRQNPRLKQERQILKKAAARFARQTHSIPDSSSHS